MCLCMLLNLYTQSLKSLSHFVFCTHSRYYINKVYLKVHAFRHSVYHSNHGVIIIISITVSYFGSDVVELHTDGFFQQF